MVEVVVVLVLTLPSLHSLFASQEKAATIVANDVDVVHAGV